MYSDISSDAVKYIGKIFRIGGNITEKAEKRKRKQKDRGIVDLMMIQSHFFKELPEWIEELKDPRNQRYITYTQADLIYMGMLKNICSIESMRQMEERFNEDISKQDCEINAARRLKSEYKRLPICVQGVHFMQRNQ